jgi:hypothetical protein
MGLLFMACPPPPSKKKVMGSVFIGSHPIKPFILKSSPPFIKKYYSDSKLRQRSKALFSSKNNLTCFVVKALKNSDLKSHKRRVHEGVRYNCDICKYSASSQYLLKTHKVQIKLLEIKLRL